jgi:tripartite-type tricarboxylate transporter receptor subunit TctC
MREMDRRDFGLGLMAGLGASTLLGAREAAASWSPDQPIEFVIMAGEGGGADRLARFIIKIIEKYDLSDQPFLPMNKGGQSGAEAMLYLKHNVGSTNLIMATLNSLYTTPLRKPALRLDIREFTPVVTLAIDSFLLWVNAKSGIKDIDDYVRAVKAAGPGGWTMGGTGKGQEDSLVTAMLEKAYGIKHRYKAYKGGGSVAKALIARKIDSTVNNPSEQMDFYLKGKSRPIAAFTPVRLEMFPDVPTFRELGHDHLVYHMQRGVLAPPEVPREALIYYEKLFTKVEKTEEWRSYAKKKSLARHWLKRAMLKDFMISELNVHKRLLRDMGKLT